MAYNNHPISVIWLIMSRNNLSTAEKILKGDGGVACVLALGTPVPSLPGAQLSSAQGRPHPAEVLGDSWGRNEVFGHDLFPGVGVGRDQFSHDVFMRTAL